MSGKITLQLTIETTNDRLTQCISAAHEKAYGEPLPTIQIVPFKVGALLTPNDLEIITAGSCLGELTNDNSIMKVVE